MGYLITMRYSGVKMLHFRRLLVGGVTSRAVCSHRLNSLLVRVNCARSGAGLPDMPSFGHQVVTKRLQTVGKSVDFSHLEANMNALTAVRSFARPGYCPVKHVRIFDNRYYVVRMQNVETDPRCDYVGLAEGEYTELMPGNKARERRDSRLNHCNGIAEWTGPVYCVTVYQFNRPRQWPEYAGNHTEVEAIVQRNNAEADKHFRGFQHDIDYYANQTPESMEERAKITGIGSAFLGIPAYWQGQATKDHENAARMAVQLARERAEYAAGSWRTEVEKVR